jgi:hypothetical protein
MPVGSILEHTCMLAQRHAINLLPLAQIGKALNVMAEKRCAAMQNYIQGGLLLQEIAVRL